MCKTSEERTEEGSEYTKKEDAEMTLETEEEKAARTLALRKAGKERRKARKGFQSLMQNLSLE